VFRHSLAREAASAIGGRVARRAFVSRFASVRLQDVAELPLPARDWVRVETTVSGLCGSDIKQILLNGSRDNPPTALADRCGVRVLVPAEVPLADLAFLGPVEHRARASSSQTPALGHHRVRLAEHGAVRSSGRGRVTAVVGHRPTAAARL
jgi:hypothetical protein